MIEFEMPQRQSGSGAKPARVFLIDSMSHIFRAFYAPLANRAAPLQTSKGQVTQANRLGAGWTVVVEDSKATVREPGRPDWAASLDELVDRLAG